MPNAIGLTTLPSRSPSLNHSRFGAARSAGFQMAIMAKTTATPRAHHRGVSPWNNGQPAISRNTPANTRANARFVGPSTCCSRDKSSCAMAHQSCFLSDFVSASCDAQQPQHQRLLYVKAILRFIDRHVTRTVQDPIACLDIAAHGQAVAEYRIVGH